MPHFDLVGFIKAVGYVGVFGMMLAESGLLGDLIHPEISQLVTAGLLAAMGHLSIWVLASRTFVPAGRLDAVGHLLGSVIPDFDRVLIPIGLLIIVVSVAPRTVQHWRVSRQEASSVPRMRFSPVALQH